KLDPEKFGHAVARISATQRELWTLASEWNALERKPFTTQLFISALNNTIDQHSRRVASIENHVPEPALILLAAIATIGVGLTGFGCGLGPRRDLWPALCAALLIGLVIILIIDL